MIERLQSMDKDWPPQEQHTCTHMSIQSTAVQVSNHPSTRAAAARTCDKEGGVALPEQLALVGAGVAAQHRVGVDVVGVVGVARHVVCRHQHLVKVLQGSAKAN